MSPPPLPLDHLIISNKDRGGGLFLGLALRTTAAVATTPPALDLSLSSSSSGHKPNNIISYDQPSLTLSLLLPAKKFDAQSSTGDDEISSFSNNSVSVKREREEEPDDQLDASGANIDLFDDVSNTSSRKKLRLNKHQSALLEDSFKLQSTLNPKQKEALARQLNLRPRQVEVWFQNRRARTKLKQTEVDCEVLKKCCERLTEENERLHKELKALKQASRQQQPFYMRLPPTMCPSCDTLTDAPSSKNSLPNMLTSSKKRMIFNPFVTKQPSAAC
uniref:Homeobox domain-containing protein n=1 Tax=Kalanchoe fedtschenkoi TaxID=63787 RepID=A0A7N0TIY7_KALFE